MTADHVPNVPPVPPTQPPWPPTGLPARRAWRRTVAVLAAVAVVAVGLAIVGWLRPTKPAPGPTMPTYTEQQVADAKAHVCATYDEVHQAVMVNTGRSGGSARPPSLPVLRMRESHYLTAANISR